MSQIRPRPEELEQVIRLFVPEFGLQSATMQTIARGRAEHAWAIIIEPLVRSISEMDGERELLLRRLERQQREILAIKRRLDTALTWIRQRRDQTTASPTAPRSRQSNHRAGAPAPRADSTRLP